MEGDNVSVITRHAVQVYSVLKPVSLDYAKAFGDVVIVVIASFISCFRCHCA
jgi:hypothetical protein